MSSLHSTSKYPLTSAYVAGLPDGLDGYKACLTSPVFSNLLYRDHAELFRDNVLPQHIRTHLDGPWNSHSWIPITTVGVLLMMLKDAVYPSAQEFEARIFDYNRENFQQPLFRLMMHVVSPTLMIMGAASRWEKFYRGGCTLEVRQSHKYAAQLQLGFPAKVMPHPYLVSMGTVFRAAIAGTRARNTACVINDVTTTSCMYDLTWE